MQPDLIGVDADDTLWHNESFFRLTHDRFAELLAPFAPADDIEARLLAVETRNLKTYGYGVKGFTLSMLETALEVSDGQVTTAVMRDILAAGREMMTHPVEALDGVHDALAALADRSRLVLITKGDLFHQEAKLAASGLGDFFSGIEIVSDKSPATYTRIFNRHAARPDHTVMAGNSVRSDILPALECGVWAHEHAAPPTSHPRFRQLDRLADLPGWVDEMR